MASSVGEYTYFDEIKPLSTEQVLELTQSLERLRELNQLTDDLLNALGVPASFYKDTTLVPGPMVYRLNPLDPDSPLLPFSILENPDGR